MTNNQLLLFIGLATIACTIYLKMDIETHCDGTNFISMTELKQE